MSTETESYILLEEQDPDYAGSDSWWRKGSLRFAADDAEVRYIARKAIELAVGLTRNPDRPEAVPFRELSS
jgi:hypothetical protein